MPTQSRLTYIQHMVLMMVIAVVGWAVFLGLFLLIFTDNYEPSESRTVWWVWLIVGTIVTVITMFVCFRVLQTPRQWRSSAAIALFAPAMCLGRPHHHLLQRLVRSRPPRRHGLFGTHPGRCRHRPPDRDAD